MSFRAGAPIKARMDIAPDVPDNIIGFVDIPATGAVKIRCFLWSDSFRVMDERLRGCVSMTPSSSGTREITHMSSGPPPLRCPRR